MRKALVVGIDGYAGAPLAGCVNDANAVAAVLEANGDGSPNFSVRLMTNPGNSVSKAILREAIDQLYQGDPDVALFYFSGHGFVNTNGGIIVTDDYQKYDEGISMDEILNYANKASSKERIIILDCCHSGSFGSPAIDDSKKAHLSQGLTVLTACKGDEVALESGGSGIFTSLVVDALRGGGADLRGHITPGSVYAYVDQALGPWDQRPIFKTNVTKFTSLRNIQPPVPLATLRRLTKYFSSPTDEISLDPSFEDTSDQADEKNVETFKDLQKMEGVGLVVPVSEEHMYYAAMNSKSSRLTALGGHYWRLVDQKKI
jgi:uncharacterized caspase-like protein